MHPDIAYSIAKSRHDELTRHLGHRPAARRSGRRFWRRRQDVPVPAPARSAELVALPPPRERDEIGGRRVA